MKIKNIVSDWDGVFVTGKNTRELAIRSIKTALIKESLNPFSKMRKYPRCRLFHLLKADKKFELLKEEKKMTENFEYSADIIKFFNENFVKGLPTNYIYSCISKAVWKKDVSKDISKKMLRVFAKLRKQISYMAILSDNSQIGILEMLYKMKFVEIFDDIVGTNLISEDRIVVGFGYETEGKKHKRLLTMLKEKDLSNTAYIGDGMNDTNCFEIVKFPIVSPYASDSFKQMCGVKYKAFVPKDESDLKDYVKNK